MFNKIYIIFVETKYKGIVKSVYLEFIYWVFEMWSLHKKNCSREPVERHNLNNSNQNIHPQLEHNVIIGNLKIYKYFSFVKKIV